MVEKLLERKQREIQAVSATKSNRVKPMNNDKKVSDDALFKSLGKKLKVVKKNAD